MVNVDQEFVALVERITHSYFSFNPTDATWLGAHSYDHLLEDFSDLSVAARISEIHEQLEVLDAVDDVELSLAHVVDLETLRVVLQRELMALETIEFHRWNPLVSNPGTALHLLMSRDFAPLESRWKSAAARLVILPALLRGNREVLGGMPLVHIETAIGQFSGTRQMIAEQMPDHFGNLWQDSVAKPAIAAIDEHVEWLRAQKQDVDSHVSPRLGAEKFAAWHWLTLDSEMSSVEILESAEADLEIISLRLRETAAQYLGAESATDTDVVAVLNQLADEGVVTNDSIMELSRSAFDAQVEFVKEHRLVTVFDDPVEIIEMPEIHRGVAVAYCDAPGPLETTSLPTFFAVSPTPSDWDEDRVRSFYREYNAHQLHELAIHEGVPGHVLQLGHARRCVSDNVVRAAFFSGPFVEGWAVYAEELMCDRGYPGQGGPLGNVAMRMQQLKMQLRMVINTILDIRVHMFDMSESEAMELMVRRGFQEEGEAVGKWRRALLTAGQLSTYYVGYKAVSAIAQDLRAQHSDWSDVKVHDTMLQFGSPSPRLLRDLLDLL